jgi:hypothetical protein
MVRCAGSADWCGRTRPDRFVDTPVVRQATVGCAQVAAPGGVLDGAGAGQAGGGIDSCGQRFMVAMPEFLTADGEGLAEPLLRAGR